MPNVAERASTWWWDDMEGQVHPEYVPGGKKSIRAKAEADLNRLRADRLA